jgi:tetratricopeptide (TPR) repeat protein
MVFAVLHPGASRSQRSNQVLVEADRLAWLSNWQRAGELYARAEKEAFQDGDERDRLYAACGRLRANIGTESVLQASAELALILKEPIAAGDPRLRIRCLATKGDILREDHPDYATKAWQEVFNLAQRLDDEPWRARAQAELGIIGFMNGDTKKARDLLASALKSATKRVDLPTMVLYGSQVGNGLVEMGRDGEALEYCNAALRVAGMVKDMGFPYSAYGCKGRALAMLGRTNEARALLLQTLNQTLQLHMPL